MKHLWKRCRKQNKKPRWISSSVVEFHRPDGFSFLYIYLNLLCHLKRNKPIFFKSVKFGDYLCRTERFCFSVTLVFPFHLGTICRYWIPRAVLHSVSFFFLPHLKFQKGGGDKTHRKQRNGTLRRCKIESYISGFCVLRCFAAYHMVHFWVDIFHDNRPALCKLCNL